MISVVLAQARGRYGCLALQIADGEPLFVHAARSLRAHEKLRLAPMVIAVPHEIADEVRRVGKDALDAPRPVVLPTGATCLDGALHDVLDGMDGFGFDAPAPDTAVLVHDMRRAFVDHELVDRVLAAASHGTVVPVQHLVDTVKEVDPGGRIVRTIERERLAHVQTPQIATLAALQTLHRGCPPGGDPELIGLVGAGLPTRQVIGNPSGSLVTEPFIGVNGA